MAFEGMSEMDTTDNKEMDLESTLFKDSNLGYDDSRQRINRRITHVMRSVEEEDDDAAWVIWLSIGLATLAVAGVVAVHAIRCRGTPLAGAQTGAEEQLML